jgi:2-desacetyl-2-hydroxyethyl bacteriochlorophyllide A dehydrogenase
VFCLKRLVWEGGSRFRYVPTAAPELLLDGNVLVRPTAVGICGTDVHIIEGQFPTVQPPLVLGHEIAGVVAAIGPGVHRVKAGDRVTIDQVIGCGACFFCNRGSRQFCPTGFELGITADGGCQEALVVPQENVFAIPPTISDEAAAILDMEVWGAVSKCGVHPGDTVVVFGPGPAGMVACQVARILGAGRVILVGPDGARIGHAQKLGLADAFILIDRENVVDRILQETGGLGANMAIECAGAADALGNALDAVMPGGRIVTYGVHTRPFESFDVNRIVLRDLVVFGALSDRRGWEKVIELVSQGKLLLEPLISHRFPFEDAPAAYDLVRRSPDGLIKAVITF